MLWIILVALIYLGGFVGLYFVVGKKTLALDRVLEHNFESVQAEKKIKVELLTQIGQAVKGLVTSEAIEQLDKPRMQVRITAMIYSTC